MRGAFPPHPVKSPSRPLRILRVPALKSFFLVVDRLRARGRRIAEAAAGEDRFASAKGGDARRLVGLRQGVGGVGVDDTAQFRLALGEKAAIAGFACQIAGFLRVGAEIEELRRNAEV